MILENIFMWVGGITLILFMLYLALSCLDRLWSGYAKSLGIFWRIIYGSLFIKDKERWLNKIINETNGRKYKIIEIKSEQALKGDKNGKI